MRNVFTAARLLPDAGRKLAFCQVPVVLLLLVVSMRMSSALAAAGCERYAADAVNENRQNIEQRCGYTGPRWSSDYQARIPRMDRPSADFWP